MPLEQTSQFFADIFGYKLNSQTIVEVLKRSYELSAPLAKQIKVALESSKVAYFDETGIQIEGKLYWLHSRNGEQLTEARRQYDELLTKAKGGDVERDEQGITD